MKPSTIVITAAAAALASMAFIGSALAADFGPPPPRAMPMPPPAPIVYAPVNYHCMRWTDICDRRWGFGSRRFARCMWRHDCPGPVVMAPPPY